MNTVKKSVSQLKREAIIEAAKKMFKEQGVASTSMDKLAEVAQVSKRTVYNHFATKEALVMYLLGEFWLEAISFNQGVYDPDQDLLIQLREIILTEIGVINSVEHIDMARLIIGHLFYSCEQMSQEIEKMKQHETATLRWIKAAQADGRITVKDVQHANQQMMHLIKGQAFWPQIMACDPLLTEDEKRHLAHETAKMFLSRYQ
ncbi:TetR/AcrR family transcriptional regulator [Shewanella gaetbuli]|uniref:TetR/AcrR family transcriptional regulator n=1 Tax=Shewanella gaetbuli TaxID=220752 RepID=A0A9X1ZNM3_9GAMM|nr:TetR/AcrR family transcriptional regulator [Shewanella gaetbuli]MCL1142780.1 TetR/AcrR family transcriptional regulator [Shewanella gaetbuli]